MRKPIIHSWSFTSDQLNSYAWLEDVLTKEECDRIVKLNQSKIKTSKVGFHGDKVDKKIRNSYIKFISPDSSHKWLYKRLSGAILKLNKLYFNFDLTGLIEGIQYTNYKAEKGHYKKHVDCAFDGLVRKLSISVQLTDPTQYEGGDLILHHSHEGVTMKKNQGCVCAFPSYTLHEVTPVTKGERNSLVCWVNGPQFK